MSKYLAAPAHHMVIQRATSKEYAIECEMGRGAVVATERHALGHWPPARVIL